MSLSAFDYDVSAATTIVAEVGEPGETLISGRLLGNLVRTLPAAGR